MENKNIGLKVLVIILSLLVVALSGYLVYDKVLSNEEPQDENQNNTVNNAQETAEITEEEIKEIFGFVYNYYELPVVYCGKTDNNIVQMHGIGRKDSVEFTTYEQMLNSLKKYMTIDVIADKQAFAATTKEYYLEQDGKLYCNETYKGYPYGQGNVDIEITSQDDNKIECVATMELTDMSNNKTHDKVDIVLEKNNDNWIVTKYEKQNTELR